MNYWKGKRKGRKGEEEPRKGRGRMDKVGRGMGRRPAHSPAETGKH